MLPDGRPGQLTRDRAEWLAYYLVAAGAWERMKALLALRWRRAFLVATGSDAAFPAALDHYGRAASAQAPDAVYHAVRAWLFAAHVRALIGQLSIPMLVAIAVVGDPIAGITQAGQHPSAREAVPAVLAAVADRLETRFQIERAVAVAGAIPDNIGRSQGLASIAERLAFIDSARAAALIEQAVAVAKAIPGGWERSEALADIARWLAVVDPAEAAAMAGQAVAVAEATPDGTERSRALAGIAGRLAGIAERLAVADPGDPALIERALSVAETIPDARERGRALAGIAERLAAADPGDPALIERAISVAEAIPEGWERSGALAGIAERLAHVDPARTAALIEQAVAATETIPVYQRRSTLTGIAGRLADANFSDAALIPCPSHLALDSTAASSMYATSSTLGKRGGQGVSHILGTRLRCSGWKSSAWPPWVRACAGWLSGLPCLRSGL